MWMTDGAFSANSLLTVLLHGSLPTGREGGCPTGSMSSLPLPRVPAAVETRRRSLLEVLAVTMFQPQAIAVTAFGVVMAAAAVEDFRRLVIPNLLPILLCVLWPIYFAAAPSLYGAFAAIGCALAVFV